MLLRRAFSSFRLGDSVLIRALKNPRKSYLSPPLSAEDRLQLKHDYIPHARIVGLKSQDVVRSAKGDPYVVTDVSMEDYINLTKKESRPVHPLDAASIVTLADLHIDYPELDEFQRLKHPPLQFLEARSGHGSLTLAICNKIHPANCYMELLGQRGAILHSIDTNDSLIRGMSNVQNFKRGMYLKDVDFHKCKSPYEWLRKESQKYRDLDDEKEFLSGAFLDLRAVIPNLEEVSENLKQDAPLVISFNSIRQALDVVKHVESDKSINLIHSKTVELKQGFSGDLKAWNARFNGTQATQDIERDSRRMHGSKSVGMRHYIGVFRKGPIPKHGKIVEEKKKFE